MNEKQPTIRWMQNEMLHIDTGRQLQVSAENPFRAQGLSGGPVFLTATRPLAGWITDSDSRNNERLFFFPIARALRRLDSDLKEAAYEIR